MRPLRLRIEQAVYQILHFGIPRYPSYQTRDTQSSCELKAPQEKTALVQHLKTSTLRTRTTLRQQYRQALESFNNEELRAATARILASGLAQGAAGFSLTVAASVFQRANQARGYYIAKIARPLRPKRIPVFFPALRQGYSSAVTGMQTSLIDELLLRYRGEDKAASNAFLSGCCVGVLENRKEGLGTMVEEGLRGGTTAWLFHVILGGADEAPLSGQEEF
eukprot:Protomagalhaensia_wolfi_Nauph_80__2916@NODE_29_length_4648_cov_36_430679_g24_i0_p4_GENE_NODE_29_length_4648_cov_36_430679_g24_i0NODE_29_length_4648_cov_36_430679_g24_i0_p4_ORF_typecomplete_len221_score20_27Tim17/PF02466_19/0_02TetR_C_31/PF17940_1/1_4TetR_C_31/PF17940_1/2_4e02_NODE_29_length_4648_cov_36_430679_g24_i016102272